MSVDNVDGSAPSSTRSASVVSEIDNNNSTDTLNEVFSSLVSAITRLSQHLPSISGKFLLSYIHKTFFIRKLFILYSQKFLFIFVLPIVFLLRYPTFRPIVFFIPILFLFPIVLARQLFFNLYHALNYSLFDRILFCATTIYALLVYFLITSSSGIYITSISLPQLLILFHF